MKREREKGQRAHLLLVSSWIAPKLDWSHLTNCHNTVQLMMSALWSLQPSPGSCLQVWQDSCTKTNLWTTHWMSACGSTDNAVPECGWSVSGWPTWGPGLPPCWQWGAVGLYAGRPPTGVATDRPPIVRSDRVHNYVAHLKSSSSASALGTPWQEPDAACGVD